MNGRRAVVFDIGKVLVNFDPALAVRNLAAATGARAELVERALFAGHHREAYSCGRLDAAGFHTAFAAALVRGCADAGLPSPRALTFEAFDRAWSEMFWPMEGMDALAAEVAALCPVLLCSNTDPLHYRYLQATVPSLRLARHAVLSYEVGEEKPGPAIYAVLQSRVPVPPACALFVDDRADNVAGAHRAGFDALQFTDAAALRGELRARGLLVAAAD